jgi:hypothetical protein
MEVEWEFSAANAMLVSNTILRARTRVFFIAFSLVATTGTFLEPS